MSGIAPVSASPAPRGAEATRQRIVAAATELFLANGVGATSADRIIERVGITKVTFYRHFRTKNDLVVAYLEGQAAGERGFLLQARQAGTAVEALDAIAAGIGRASCQAGFRGCPFINAAAEFPEATHPVRVVVDAHRRWASDLFAGIAAEAGASDPAAAARQLLMLRDGAMVGGALGDPSEVGETLRLAFAAVLPSGGTRTGAGPRG